MNAERICNPDGCPHCLYIGEGDSYCEAIGEIVLEDWAPTGFFMGRGCPYRRNRPSRGGGSKHPGNRWRRQRKDRKEKHHE